MNKKWIKIFDKNIYAIIAIMILVAGINMITALLVLILERTQMIGILKALGSNNWSIRKLFLYNASYLIVLGLFLSIGFIPPLVDRSMFPTCTGFMTGALALMTSFCTVSVAISIA